jgi:hypothetical protein
VNHTSAGTGRVLMNSHQRGIHRHLAIEFIDRFGDHLHSLHEHRQGAVA